MYGKLNYNNTNPSVLSTNNFGEVVWDNTDHANWTVIRQIMESN